MGVNPKPDSNYKWPKCCLAEYNKQLLQMGAGTIFLQKALATVSSFLFKVQLSTLLVAYLFWNTVKDSVKNDLNK